MTCRTNPNAKPHPMRVPCPNRSSHTHAVSINGTFRLRDRCRSGLLWSMVARAIVKQDVVLVDDRPVQWNPDETPYAYLRRTANRKWWRDLPGDCDDLPK